MRVFLSYRRADVGGYAGRFSDLLVRRLGVKNVFQDVTSIRPGQDFVGAVRHALDTCDVAVAVIGPGWVTAVSPEGRRRLFEPDDYVRVELATALAREVPVVPVLVGGAELPTAGDLPEDLHPLLQRQAVVLHDETWHQDVEDLLRSLRGQHPAAPGTRRAPLLAIVGIVVLAAIVAGLWWRPWEEGSRGAGTRRAADGPTSGPAVSPSCPVPTGRGWTAFTLNQNPTARQEFDDGYQLFTVRAASWRPLEQGRWQVIVDTSVANRRTSNNFDHYPYRYEGIIVGQQFPLSCFESSSEALTPGTAGQARTGWVVSCQPTGRVDLLLYLGTRLPVTDAAEPSAC